MTNLIEKWLKEFNRWFISKTENLSGQVLPYQADDIQYDDSAAEHDQDQGDPDVAIVLFLAAGDGYSGQPEQQHEQHEDYAYAADGPGTVPGYDRFSEYGAFIGRHGFFCNPMRKALYFFFVYNFSQSDAILEGCASIRSVARPVRVNHSETGMLRRPAAGLTFKS